MKRILYFLLFIPAFVLSQNYVKTTTYRTATTTSLSSPSVDQAVVEKVFTDALGRPIQHIAHKQSTSQKDVVRHIHYDSYGRESRTYLPYVSGSASMNFDADAQMNTEVYYNKPEYQHTLNPYSEQFYEPSPLNRVLKQGAPGNDWKGNTYNDNDKTIKFGYNFNDSDEVKLFKVTTTINSNGVYQTTLINNSGSVYYAANELYKSVITDENGHKTIEFKDKQDRVVLKRALNVLVEHDTYYVYDAWGNLSFVIPPLAVNKASISEEVLNDLCYRYQYDKHNRLVEKKQPGKAWEYIVYDKRDRVVATGPVYSPFTNENSLGWNVIKYDAFGRVAYTGWSTQQPTTAVGRKNFQTQVDAMQHLYVTRVNSTVDGVAIGYTNNATYPTALKLLTVNYYDTYTYPGALTAPGSIEGQSVTSNLKGLPTGSWVRVLTTSSVILAEKTQIFYDHKGRTIGVYKQNHWGGYTHIESKRIDFSGVVEYVLTKHKKTNEVAETLVREDFVYTPHGRLLKHSHKVNTLPSEVLTYNTYDELGQLTTKKVGRNEITPLQTVDYKYNIRGWLTDINNVDSLGDDLFAFKINYQNPAEIAPNNPALYNGNITETFWRTSNDNTLRKYRYKYDGLNRLTSASYKKPLSSGAGLVFSSGNYDEFVSYDKNGNIKTLERYGDLDDAVDNIIIDNLNYTYDAGNKLVKVKDASNHPEGFKDGANNNNEYGYDNYGNMIRDDNKGIESITYNHLNLPKKTTFISSQNINYIYNALGEKVKKEVTNGTVVTTADYQNIFQYENNALRIIATAEGYVNVSGGGVSNGIGYMISFNYVYNYTDHLGNIRLSYTKGKGTNPAVILEENHYYPFGLKHKKYGSVDKDFIEIEGQGGYYVGIDIVPPQTRKPYQYKYNGQEWQDELDLNVTAMDFRQYDNALGRFHNMDRLTELAPSITPYRFGFNNPNYWSDPTGLFETRELALAHISNNNLTGADVFENVDGTFSIFHQVGNGSYTITMIADELVISGTIKAISIGGNNGGGSNGGYLGGGAGYPSFSGSSGKGGYDSSGSGGGNSNSSGKNKGYFANYFKSYFSYKRSAHSNAYSPYIPSGTGFSINGTIGGFSASLSLAVDNKNNIGVFGSLDGAFRIHNIFTKPFGVSGTFDVYNNNGTQNLFDGIRGPNITTSGSLMLFGSYSYPIENGTRDANGVTKTSFGIGTPSIGYGGGYTWWLF